MMPTEVVVFDVNETLSDMEPLAKRFADVGASEDTAKLWFTGVLRDGMSLAAAGTSEKFGRIAEEALRFVFSNMNIDRATDEAVAHVMSGFQALGVHPDVAPAVRRLKELGLRLITLTNGSSETAHGLLERSGLRDSFEAVLSVDSAGFWKPAGQAYAYAARACGVEPAAMLMVAVHPWDTDGAARAGLRTAWVDRTGAPYPGYFTPPDITVRSMADLADEIS